jgi:hypothetical protein
VLLQWNLIQDDLNSNLTLFGFSFLVPIVTCKGASNFLIQVSQSKFTVLNIGSRKNFDEFITFFPKGLNPFKIQTKFKCSLVSDFLIRILLIICNPSLKESCSF